MKPRPGDWTDVLSQGVIENYVGRHIAIIFKRVVAVGDSYDQVLEEALRLFPEETPYLAFIPAKDAAPEDAVAAVQASGPAAPDEGVHRDSAKL